MIYRGRPIFWVWLIANAIMGTKDMETLRDIHTSSRTYQNIKHRSQKKLRRLARQRA